MSRELARRLAALEQRHGADRRYYTVSDLSLNDQQWDAKKEGADITIDEPHGSSPLLTEAEWTATYCCD